MKQNRQLVTLLLLAIVLGMSYALHLKAATYQSVQLRPLTEKEKAQMYLLSKVNSVKVYSQLSKVVQAESSWDIYAYNSQTKDTGLFQINETYHLERSKELGIDIHTVEGNIDYALLLYKDSGLRPWSASKPIWSKM